MATIDVLTSIDIDTTIRNAVDPNTLIALGDPSGHFIQGDISFILTIYKEKQPEDMSSLATDLLLSFSSSTSPDSPVLVVSDAPTVSGGDSNVLTFGVNTATVELQEYLQDLLGREVIIELIDNTVPAFPVVMAQWTYMALNQGFNLAVPVYTNLQHKVAIDPDRAPLVTDDDTQGFSLGSIWLYHNLANPTNAQMFALQNPATGAANWVDMLASGASIVDSVFTRTGDVIAEASDYDASQIDNDSAVAGATVADALNNLDTQNVSNIIGGLQGIGINQTNTSSFGANAAVAPPVVTDGEIVGLSIALTAPLTQGTCEMQLTVNGVAQTAVGQTILLSAGGTDQFDFLVLDTPIPYSAGDRIGHQTVTITANPQGADATLVARIGDT